MDSLPSLGVGRSLLLVLVLVFSAASCADPPGIFDKGDGGDLIKGRLRYTVHGVGLCKESRVLQLLTRVAVCVLTEGVVRGKAH